MAGRPCIDRQHRGAHRRSRYGVIGATLLALLGGSASGGAPDAGTAARAQAPVLSPEDEARTFTVADGFRLELFASEPMVQDPVAIAFDEDGRAWVVEMRGYMQDVDGRGEDQGVGRISILEDIDDDGRADRARVFLDGLVMPRSVAPTRGGALVAHGGRLWFARDRDGDGRADEQVVVDESYIVGDNPEHSANGFARALDNWWYSAKSDARFRRVGDRWVKDATEFRGQWGIVQDDHGRLHYNYNSDQLRADLVPPNTIGRNRNHPSKRGINVRLTSDQRVFPGGPTPGVNRGYRPDSLDPRGRLISFTAACAPVVYRGDVYPPAFRGNVLVLEPSANLVKRNVLTETGFTLQARSAYDDSELITSSDERFRPVHAAQAPDGTLWIVDMYRGIIQHRHYVTPYLREHIVARGLQRPLHHGRIWRLVGPDGKRGTGRPGLSSASNRALVAHLAHPNGWWRDTAQRMLIERQARAMIPALTTLALRGGEPLARVHALWTLEALGHPRPHALLPALDDPEPKVQIAAMRVLESWARTRPGLAAAVVRKTQGLVARAPVEVRLHIALGLGPLTRGRTGLSTLLSIAARDGADPVMRDAVLASVGGREFELLQLALADRAFDSAGSGLEGVLRSLATAVARQNVPARVAAVKKLAESQSGEKAWRRKALLAGLETKAAETKKRAAPKQDAGPGRNAFIATCAPCHGAEGLGQEAMAPPLAGSEWVTGPAERLVRIVLFGLEGPIHVNGQRYEPPQIMPNMPAVEGFTDESLVSTLNFVRKAFGRDAPPVPLEVVRKVRSEQAARSAPYTEGELLNHGAEVGRAVSPPPPAPPAR